MNNSAFIRVIWSSLKHAMMLWRIRFANKKQRSTRTRKKNAQIETKTNYRLYTEGNFHIPSAGANVWPSGL
jgi:hypothetical protein